MSEVIARGAEAVLSKERREGKDVLVKDRIAKGYRLKVIDDKLRRERTRGEARLLREAMRAGVDVPRVLEERGFELVEEFVEGKRLKELLNGTDERQRKRVAGMLGEAVGRLHSAGIIHGDLTTSNMILAENKSNMILSRSKESDGEKNDIAPSQERGEEKIYFIDFGLGFLSEKPEDQGTDLAVLREAFQSTHFRFLDGLWGSFEVAYRKTFRGSDQALKALAAIERRGRYVRRAKG